jgi:hypothetical protein
MKNLTLFTIYLLALAGLAQPMLVTAQPQNPASTTQSVILVECTGTPLNPNDPNSEKECNYRDVFRQINKAINFIFLAAVPILIIVLTYSGIQILLARGNMSKLSDAKKRFQKIVIGMLVVMFAYLVVYAIAKAFLRPEYYNLFLGDPSAPPTTNTTP